MMDDPWQFVPRRRPHAALRLICLPFAGGAASAFRSWADALPESVEVRAIQLPGREGRFAEPAMRQLPQVLQALAGALRPITSCPYAVFGHSMGSILAFELVRLLRRQGQSMPRHLFVSGRRAPHLSLGRRPFHDLPEMDLVAEIRRFDGDAHGLLDSAEMRALLLPAVRADFALHDSYVYRDEAPLDVPMTAFGGMADATTSEDDLHAWQQHCLLPMSVQMYAGGHFFIETQRKHLLQAISAQLRLSTPDQALAG